MLLNEMFEQEDLYFVQPDGSFKKKADGRSKGLTKAELPKDAVLQDELKPATKTK